MKELKPSEKDFHNLKTYFKCFKVFLLEGDMDRDTEPIFHKKLFFFPLNIKSEYRVPWNLDMMHKFQYNYFIPAFKFQIDLPKLLNVYIWKQLLIQISWLMHELLYRTYPIEEYIMLRFLEFLL